MTLRKAGRWAIFPFLLISMTSLNAAGWKLIGWNDLGMHCMDSDYQVFSILPPYNNIHAQLIDNSGRLIRDPGGIVVTYEAVADPTGSIDSTSAGKTNFWSYVGDLFGVDLAPDQGLAGNDMPGPGNQPQPMAFDAAMSMFQAEGVPLTPYDDSGHKNFYPMFKLVARDSGGTILATTDVVLPISDEMDCSRCHASGSDSTAEPTAGWVNDPDSERDFRLNILRLHDEKRGGSLNYQDALSAAGYSTQGLYSTVTVSGVSVLCSSCHASNALPGTGIDGIPPLTRSIHGFHANVTDPLTDQLLDASQNRTACYSCHPGSETRCLRGVMGNAVAADGSMEIQCQNCHGTMSRVGASSRQGWLDEPACQSCHTGTAVTNRGNIRFASAFEQSGQVRTPADSTFATNSNTPATGFSLYRFSSGHGNLQCEACHGSTHAEYPTSHQNDNIQSLQLQGHVGTISECTTCHVSAPSTVTGGPHGMHPVGQSWVSRHSDVAEHQSSQCQTCHGTDYRGTVLSRALGDRSLNSDFGSLQLWRGFQIGCYACHNGPNSEHRNSNSPPSVQDMSASGAASVPISVQLHATDPNGDVLSLRIVSQPTGGTVSLSGTQATYFSFAGFSGSDTFTYAAWDGSTNSNLGHVQVQVSPGQVNTPPSVDAGPNQVVNAGSTVALTGSGSDHDGDPLDFSWTQLSGPSVELQTASQANAQFVAPNVVQTTDLVFSLAVSDGAGGQATDQVTITVLPAAVTDSVFYFPQIGNGAGAQLSLQTTLILLNTGADTISTLEFFDRDGNPMNVALNGLGQPQSVYSLSLIRGAARKLTTTGEGALQVGYARISAGTGVDGTAVYRQIDSLTGIALAEAGVPSSTPLTSFSLFMDSSGSNNTGLAILNPRHAAGSAGVGTANLTLRLFDKNFTLLATSEVQLAEGSQISRFITEFFSQYSPALEMEGVVTVQSDMPVVAVTIRQNDDPSLTFPSEVPTLTVFPVVPGRADQ
ncbi:MAG: Ig-like domain-containing protein [Acidobacteriota bacterium]